MEFVFNLLKELPYGNNPYVLSLAILICFVILGLILLFLFSKYLEKFAKKTKTEVDDLIFENTKKPIFFLTLIYGFKFALINHAVPEFVIRIVESLVAIVIVLIFSRAFSVIIEIWGDAIAKKTRTKIDEVLLPLFQKSTKVIFLVIALMWVLKIWSINITPYLAGAGIIGLVIGMALQDSLKNVFGGASLLLDKNFHIGDPVRLESGELGKIKEIGLRSTKLLTFDNEVIFIPNGQLANMKIHNYLQPNSRVRKVVKFGVKYGTDVEKVKKVVFDAISKVKDIYDDPYMDVIFTDMGESSLNFQARFFVDWDNAYEKWLEVTEIVNLTLNKANIEIPFPTRTIHIKN